MWPVSNWRAWKTLGQSEYAASAPNLEVAANHITETFHVPEAGFILINNQQAAPTKLFTNCREINATRIALIRCALTANFHISSIVSS